VLVSKVLQKLSNDFDEFEESYMKPLNILLRRNKQPLSDFLSSIDVRRL